MFEHAGSLRALCKIVCLPLTLTSKTAVEPVAYYWKMTIFEDPGQDEFNGLNLRQLKIDEAYLVVKSSLDYPTFLYGRTDECDQVSDCFPFF